MLSYTCVAIHHIIFCLIPRITLNVAVRQPGPHRAVYPCSFRLFDVDDLIANILGSAIGYLPARRIGYRIRAQKLSAPQPVRPTFSRWLLVIGIDVFILLLLVEISAIFISLAHLTELIDVPYVFLFWGTLYFGIIPLFARRYRTLGRYLVGIQRNQRSR